MTGISEIRTVPVGEDLTSESLALSVVRGMERAHRVDHKAHAGLSLAAGEWGVLGNDGTVSRPGTSSVANTYLCLAGTDRFDAKATGNVTLAVSSPLVVKSNKYHVGGSYAAGTLLTVKDLGGGEASVSPAADGDHVVAMVVSVGSGYLVYQVVPTPFKK
ncbi:MAG: hypothetical protein EBZ49_00425 [Proteobacteria bacterium]|nr:hypothetical protein [Pseudomonadota bacterium]